MGDTIMYVLEYPFTSELNCLASRIQTALATVPSPEDTTVAPAVQCTTVSGILSENSTVSTTNGTDSENGTGNGTTEVNVTCEEATTTPAIVETTTTLPPLSCNGTSAGRNLYRNTCNVALI